MDVLSTSSHLPPLHTHYTTRLQCTTAVTGHAPLHSAGCEVHLSTHLPPGGLECSKGTSTLTTTLQQQQQQQQQQQ
jgi:hypothetical protein